MNGTSSAEKDTAQTNPEALPRQSTGSLSSPTVKGGSNRQEGRRTARGSDASSSTRDGERINAAALLFGIRLSIRYHAKRQGHFETIHRTLNFVLLIMGSAAVGFAFGERWWAGIGVGLTVAVISAIKTAVNPAGRAAEHRQLLKDYSHLEMKLRLNDDDHVIEECYRARLRLESIEPATLINLSFVCYNEVAVSMGGKAVSHIRQLTKTQRFLARWWDFPPYETHSRLTGPVESRQL